MRDRDIKNIINKASEGEEFSVNSEDIKNALMERIGNGGNKQESGESNIVEPMIVTVGKEKKHSFAKITAGVAAACLGFGIIGAAAYNGGFGPEQLPAYNPGSASYNTSDIFSDNISDNISDTMYSPSPASSTENNVLPSQTELTASTDNTAVPDPANKEAPVFVEVQGAVEGNFMHDISPGGIPSEYEIILLDGTVAEVRNGETYFSESNNSRMPICKEGYKIYFVADGNKRDITDQMSSEEYFCVSYVHPDTGLTHYLIAGGDLNAKYFGYIELFWLPGDNRPYVVYKYFTEGANDYAINGTFDPSNAPNSDWLDQTLNKIYDTLKEKYDITALIEGSSQIRDFRRFPYKITCP